MKKSLLFLVLITALISGTGSFAQNQNSPVKKQKRLTHQMSPEEKALFYTVGKGYVATDPPPGEVRNIAEFDQMEGVLIRYPFGISYELIASMSEKTVVTTIVETEAEQNMVTSQYQSHNVNMDNVNFLLAESDSYWTRDYGPWYIAYGDDEIGIVDFIYNRPNRPHDNAMPPKVADFLGIEWFGMDVIHTGGNYMTIGYGISSSTELVWEENPTLTHEEINQRMHDYLGIDNYMVVPDPNNTYIDHIDCWGKFLATDKVLIRSVPESHPQYDEIEATAQFYANQVSAYGNNYRVYRVYTPNNEPYTNSLILNKRVFVPVTGSSWDDDAIASYQEAMPGYEIIGMTGSWESTDALHCRTKGIADRNTLFIKHFPLLGDQPVQNEYDIEAELTAYSGQQIYDDSVKVTYWVNGGTHIEIVMTHESGKLYTATIPGAPEGSEIAYFIHAADQSGKSIDNPLIGEPDPFRFYVGEQFFPAIALDITQIDALAHQGEQDTEAFNISNTGQIDLNYSITWSTAVSEDFEYNVPDSPSQTSWNSNTYTEAGWTDLEVGDEGEIANWRIQFHWQTDQYAYESTFLVESPSGTQKTISSGLSSGDYDISLDGFNGELMQGTWKIWITDSYGDGGHQATDITVIISRNVELAQWMTVEPVSGTVAPGEQTAVEVTCDASELEIGEYDGTIFLTSNDPDNPDIEIPVHFTVDLGTGISGIEKSSVSVSNFPNPFTVYTTFEVNVTGQTNVMLTVYDNTGRKMETVFDGVLDSGNHKINWKPSLDAGVYLYILKTDYKKVSGKMIILN